MVTPPLIDACETARFDTLVHVIRHKYFLEKVACCLAIDQLWIGEDEYFVVCFGKLSGSEITTVQL